MEQHDTTVNWKHSLCSVSALPKEAEMFPDSNCIYKIEKQSA